MMNKLCEQYIRNIKSLFPIMGKSEKKYIQQLIPEILDCIETGNITSIEALYDAFGAPHDIINNYFSLADMDTLVDRIRLNKWIKRGIIICISICFVVFFIWGCTTLHAYNVFLREQALFLNTNIK